MFGLSFTKILVLAVVIIGAWQFFKWLEKKADRGGRKRVQKRESEPPKPVEDEKPGEVELEQDPDTGVWRPKQKD